MNRLFLLIGCFVLVAGCAYDPAFDLACDDEGAVADGRVCRDGVWVSLDGGTPGEDLGAGDASMADGGDEADASDASGADAADAADAADGDTGCLPESDPEFCLRLGASCGEVTDLDNCGVSRTAECGMCTFPETCGAIAPNECACPEDATVCAALSAECGTLDVSAQCGNKTMVDCEGCQPNATCSANTCGCDTGFVPDGNGACVDVDECSEMTDDCAANATCTNTPGGFTCACADGYSGDGTTCQDIDECADQTDDCDANATCTNTPGGFTCACADGYAGDGTTCQDIDECADQTDDCDANATCSNTPGGFICTCADGYAGDGTTCQDIDECADQTDDCDANASCSNTPGGFTCTCNAGYTGDGVTCTRVSYVNAVYSVEIVLPDGTSSDSASLPASVDDQNSVVFASKRTDSPGDIRNTMVDVYLSGSDTVTASRDSSGGEVVIVATVVEFDPGQVSVQSGTFTNEETVTISAVDTAKSFILFSYQGTSNRTDKDVEMMAVDFATNDSIEFGRDGNHGNMTGHWYVATAIDDQFSVEHLNGGMTNGTATVDLTINTAVDPTGTFIVYSNQYSSNRGEGRRAHVSCSLQSATSVNCERDDDRDDITRLRVQVIELRDGSVRRGGTTLGSMTLTDVTSLNPAASAKGMAWIGATGNLGAVETTQRGDNERAAAYVTSMLQSGNSEVNLERGAGGEDAIVTWEVVEWP